MALKKVFYTLNHIRYKYFIWSTDKGLCCYNFIWPIAFCFIEYTQTYSFVWPNSFTLLSNHISLLYTLTFNKIIIKVYIKSIHSDFFIR